MMKAALQRSWLRIGLVLGAAEIAYGLVFRLAGLTSSSIWGWVFYLMLPVAVWMVVRAPGSGLPSYGARVRAGSFAVAVGAAFYCAQVWLFNRFIDDSLLREVRATQLEALAGQGLEAAPLEARASLIETFTQPGAFAATVWVQLTLAGLVCALLLALGAGSARAPQDGAGV